MSNSINLDLFCNPERREPGLDSERTPPKPQPLQPLRDELDDSIPF